MGSFGVQGLMFFLIPATIIITLIITITIIIIIIIIIIIRMRPLGL